MQVLQAAQHVPTIRATWAQVTSHAVMKTSKPHTSVVIIIHFYTEHCRPQL